MHFTRKNAIFRLSKQALRNETQQGRILGNLVADGWAGAVMHKLAIQKCGRPMDQQTYQPTRQSVESHGRKEGKMEKINTDQLQGVQSQSGKIKKLTFLNALGQWFPFIFLL